MRPGSLLRFHARFELPKAGDLVRVRSRSDGRGHLLGAAGIAGDQGRGFVLVCDALALKDEAAGVPASLVVPYLLSVWSPLLHLVLGCPVGKMCWAVQDGFSRISVVETVSGSVIATNRRIDLGGATSEEGLNRIDPQLAPALMEILAAGTDAPAASGPWPALVQSPPLNVRSGGADWAA